MIGVVLAAAAIWGAGMLTKAPTSLRLVGIGLLLAAVMLLQIILPTGHPLRDATGGSIAPWLVLLVIVGLVVGYRSLLKVLRNKALGDATPTAQNTLETELERNARHIVLREIGGPGQKRLKEARVLVVGAGGLGAPVLQYLAAAGVGTIGVIDDDVVDNSNLQRQVIHRDKDIGIPKVFSAQAAMEAQNPFVTVRPYHRRLSEDIVVDLFSDYDLILDGTDNFDTRYMVNRAAVAAKKPLISGAITQWEGQVSTYHPALDAPCYECVFPTRPAEGLAPACAEAGVVGPLPGIIGSMMAVEAIKEITGAGQGLRGRLLIYDALYSECRTIKTTRRDGCAVCGQAQPD